jgi:hypothetical protein
LIKDYQVKRQPPTALDEILRRLALSIQFPVPGRILIRGVEDRVLKKGIIRLSMVALDTRL